LQGDALALLKPAAALAGRDTASLEAPARPASAFAGRYDNAAAAAVRDVRGAETAAAAWAALCAAAAELGLPGVLLSSDPAALQRERVALLFVACLDECSPLDAPPRSPPSKRRSSAGSRRSRRASLQGGLRSKSVAAGFKSPLAIEAEKRVRHSQLITQTPPPPLNLDRCADLRPHLSFSLSLSF
jgi:hypothetical protein